MQEQGYGVNNIGSLGTLMIKNMYFVGIPYGYQPMLRRPYILNNINSQNLKRIGDAFENDIKVSGKVTPSTVATQLNAIVGLRAHGEGMSLVEMPNGWGGKRFRIVMVVEVTLGARKKQYLIQGYTDYFGLSGVSIDESGLDQGMVIYINSITEIDIIYSHALGKYSFHIGETYNTLQDYVSRYEQNLSNVNNLSLIRPSDIMKANSVINSQSYNNGMSFQAPGGNLYGFGEYNANTTATSLRKNSDPSTYLTRLINGCLAGQAISSVSYDDNSAENVFVSGAANVPEPVLANNLFITKLQEATGVYSPTTLRVSDLYRLDPTLSGSGRLQVFVNDDMGEVVKMVPELGSYETSSTISPTPKNIQILELNNAITSNLLGVGLTSVTFYLNTFLSVPSLTIMHAKSLLGDEHVPECCEKLKAVFYTQIIPHFTRGGLYQYELFVNADILKDTTISVSDEGSFGTEKEIFRFPTFADALYSPMIATKEDRNIIIRDFETIYENVMLTQ